MKMNFLATLCVALSLSACGITAGTPPPATASDGGPALTAPLRDTNEDERKLKLAFESYDFALTAVDALIQFKVVEPGSHRAHELSEALLIVKIALNGANSALKAGNAESYAEALSEAQAAYDQAKRILKEIRQ